MMTWLNVHERDMCDHEWILDEFPDGWLATCRRCHLVVSASWNVRSRRVEREFWYQNEPRQPSVNVSLQAWGSALQAHDLHA